MPRWSGFPKRLFDLAAAGTALLVLSPLFALIAVAVAAKLGRPVLFVQPRPGLHGRVFRIVKFRTMLEATDAHGQVLDDAERLTRFGKFLRSASLDELPELWNILRGDMSVVGPRPLLVEYLPRYTPFQARRHEVRPGLTGWAQVNGRNAQDWEDRFALDIWYVEHISFRLDMKILVTTIGQVFRRSGISAEGSATMPRFRGSAGEQREPSE